jgi:hypothetical protein
VVGDGVKLLWNAPTGPVKVLDFGLAIAFANGIGRPGLADSLQAILDEFESAVVPAVS